MTNAPKASSDTDNGDMTLQNSIKHHPNHHHDNNNNMDMMMQDDENDNELQYDVQDHDRVKDINLSNNHENEHSCRSSSSSGHDVPPNVMISHKRKQRDDDDDDSSSEESEELASPPPQPDAKKSKLTPHLHDMRVTFTDPMTREETFIKGWNLGMSFVPPPNKYQRQKLTRLIQRNNQRLLRNDDSKDGNDTHHHHHHCLPNTQKVLIMTVAVDSQFTFNGDEYRGGVGVGDTDDDHDTLSSNGSNDDDDNDDNDDTNDNVQDEVMINHGKEDDATMFSSPIKNTKLQQHADKDTYTTRNLQQQQQQATSGATHSMIERFSVLIFLSVIVVLALMVINERNINLSSSFSSSHGHMSNNGTTTSSLSSALSNDTTTTTTTTTILQTSSFVNKNQRLEPIVLKGVMLSHVSNCHSTMVQSMYDHLVHSANSIVVDNNNDDNDADDHDDRDEMNSNSRRQQLLQWFEMRVNDTHIQPYQFHMTLLPNNTYHNNDDNKSNAIQYDFQLTPSGYMSRYMEARDILSIISNHNDQSQSSQLPPIQIILMDYSIDKTCDEYDKSSGLRNALDYYHRQNNIHNNHMNLVDSDSSSSSVLVIPVPSSRFQLKECQLILQPGSLASNNDTNMVSSLPFGPLIQRLILERYHQKRYPTVPVR